VASDFAGLVFSRMAPIDSEMTRGALDAVS